MARLKASSVMMPLLSTLAALVILAHSAEHGLEEEGSLEHSGRQRIQEVIRPEFEQNWRSIQTSDVAIPRRWNEQDQHSEQITEWGSEQEPPKRRRPGRKRKRRPHPVAPDAESEETTRTRYADALISADRDLERPREVINESEGKKRTNRDSTRPPMRRRKGQRRRQKPIVEEHTTEEMQAEEQPPNSEVDSVLPYKTSSEYEIAAFSQSINAGLAGGSRGRQDYVDSGSGDTKLKTVAPEEVMLTLHSEQVAPEVEQEERNKVQDEKVVNIRAYRRPYSLAKKQDHIPKGNAALKSLLKQSGGVSLSEILQQRNITLADLLSGRTQAISALKEPDTGSVPVEKDNSRIEDKHEKTKELKNNLNQQNTELKDDDATQELTSTTTEPDSTSKPTTETPTARPLRMKGHSRFNKQIRPTINKEAEMMMKDSDLTEKPRRRLPPYPYRRNPIKRTKPQEQPVVYPSESSPSSYSFVSENPEQNNDPHEKKSTTDNNTTDATKNFIDSDVGDTELINVSVVTTTSVPTTTPVIPPVSSTTTTEATITRVKLPSIRVNPKYFATSTETRRKHMLLKQSKKQNYSRAPENVSEAIKPKNDDILTDSSITDSNLITRYESQNESEIKTKVVTTEKKVEGTIVKSTTTTTTTPTTSTTTTMTTTKTAMDIPTTTTESTITPTTIIPIEQEESAKDEILQVLQDTKGGPRLAKILSERNMTLNELVEHRERGSSHIHLADIFHNSSKEPNPPEPFLSKSLIEPISKEIYPLRAILEANRVDPNFKISETSEPLQENQRNGPLFVELAKGVYNHENNLGIISLFKEFSHIHSKVEPKNLKKDSEGTTYFTSVMSINTTDDGSREARTSFMEVNRQHGKNIDISDITSIQKPHEEIKIHEIRDIMSDEPKSGDLTLPSKMNQIDDVDGDSLIALGDLRTLGDVNNDINHSTNEKLEVSMYEHTDGEQEDSGLLSKLPIGMRSATIASASIIALTMSLFVLSYIGYKWRQKRILLRRTESFHSKRIPSPIFESRKASKTHASNRSISPMIVTNTTYSDKMNTLDSQTAKDAQDYLWDNLRQPYK